jgi:hypothetical protein
MAKREYAAVYGTSRVPTWFKQEQDVASARRSNRLASFDGVVDTLTDEYGATKRSCYYEDEAQGGKFEVPHRRVLINPAWEGEDALDDAPQNHAAWTTVSDEYAPVDADDALGIIPDVASDFGYDDLYGVVDAYRNGGEVVAEIVLDDLRVEYEDTEYVLGFEAGYDHYGSTSVWARLLAYNTETGACLRHLSERMTCRHRGENIVERVRPWYENLLEKAERLGDKMYEVVAEADAHEIDIHALPFDMQTWFSALGYPDSYAEDAAARLPEGENPSALDVYASITTTLTREYDGKKIGRAIKKHAGRANEILFAPDAVERDVLDTLLEGYGSQSQLDAFEEGEDMNEDEVESVRARYDTLDEGVDAFNSFKERVRHIIENTEDEVDEDEGDAENDKQTTTAGGN